VAYNNDNSSANRDNIHIKAFDFEPNITSAFYDNIFIQSIVKTSYSSSANGPHTFSLKN
jgi:hypothetical protein